MDITAIFGSKVFDDSAMRKRLPKAAYESLKRTRQMGTTLDPAIADVVANAMKDWALEQGATHYTHWFQPMNNFTAGKHDSFLSTTSDGQVLLEFSSKNLVKGESDASSFPSGGLRATFEARGYTAWDPTSPAFVRDGTLYIPTAFCSYGGEALDTKTPLLRSMEALSREGVRLLRLLGNTTSQAVFPTVGAEQEYFLVDRQLYEERLDLKLCGRTLVGAKPSKGQELDDHYCGRIKLRVAAFMHDLDERLWSLGIASKTKHNEAAPAQHELAPIFSTANIACDHNQLTMEVMRITAKEHGLACLLHEKPFDGVNGSGKHNNYGLVTDDGLNLLDPGKHPQSNLHFLLMLAAFLRAVDKYADLLRMSAACPGNDRRLGACEAPPSIISVFLGGPLTEAMEAVARGLAPHEVAQAYLNTGVRAISGVQRDESDRNRTSPFAFTGNKFEFRMVGSSQSIAYPNVVLNTILAESFCDFADELEQCGDLSRGIRDIITRVMEEHSRIVFNGNNYSREWREEAARRGLPVFGSSIEAYHALADEKNIQLFGRFGVMSRTECLSRYEVLLENYCKVTTVEAATLLEMTNRQLIPASIRYAAQTASDSSVIAAAGFENTAVRERAGRLSGLTQELIRSAESLRDVLETAEGPDFPDAAGRAQFCGHRLLDAMEAVRTYADDLETMVDAKAWPIPTYTDLLHRR